MITGLPDAGAQTTAEGCPAEAWVHIHTNRMQGGTSHVHISNKPQTCLLGAFNILKEPLCSPRVRILPPNGRKSAEKAESV